MHTGLIKFISVKNLLKKTVATFLFAFGFLFNASAVYTVNFDGVGEVKGGYAVGNVTLSGISWSLDSVLIGTTAGTDKFNGIRSARFINRGIMTMLADKAGGAGTITLNHAVYGADASSTWMLEVSNDGGATWTAYTSPTITTSTAGLVSQSFTVNASGNVRVRISKLSGSTARINIDDISITDYVFGNTTTCGAIPGAPFCITGATGATFNVNFTSIGVFTATNDYTAQLSDGAGSFTIPTNIGVLSTSANAGTISVTIPAGTPSGVGYKIQIISSSPASTVMTPSAAFSIYLNTPEVSGLSGAAGNAMVNVTWTNPLGCFDQVLIVAQPISSIVATPVGTVYTANSVYGSGTPFGSGFVVYYGVGTAVSVTSLTNATLYYFKAFVVKAGVWSLGIEVSATPNIVVAGDYETRSPLAAGNWNINTTWEKWNGAAWVACAAGDFPGFGLGAGVVGTSNATVRTGTTVTLTASAVNTAIKGLTVQSGAKLFANNAANRYITIYGDVLNNGTIGNGATLDGISFNIEGTNSTVSGPGAFDLSRIRKNFSTNSVSNLILAPTLLNLHWSAASGTALYNGTSTPSAIGTFNVTINVNSVVNIVLNGGTSGNVSINNTAGVGSCDGTFTVNGTLNIPGVLYGSTSYNTAGKSSNWVIGPTGIIRCNTIQCAASGTAGFNFTIQNGGRLILDNNSTLGAQDPFPGWSLANNTYTLQPGSIVEYADNAAAGNSQVVNPNLTYSNLVISGASDKTVAATLTVNQDLTILAGQLQPSANTISLGGDWNDYTTAGFAEATSKVIFRGTILETIYSAGGENFYNVDVSNSVGVALANDITIAHVLDMTTTGKMIFGLAQHIVTLSDMSAGSDAFHGSGSAFMDLTNANHYLYIGSQNASYSGGFNAGAQSFVVYYRNNAINGLGVGGGDQNLMMNIVYANLSMIGTDNKFTNDNFTVNVDAFVDGPFTVMHATVISKTMTLGGNFTLSGGATMDNDCCDDMTLLTQFNTSELFDANFQTIKCYDLLSTKTTGGILLSNGATTLDIKDDMIINYTGAAAFVDNTNTIKVGDDVEIGNNFANFNFTGTLEFTGIGANTDIHLSDLTGAGVPLAVFKNITVNTGVQAGILRIVEMMPTTGNQIYTITGNVLIVQGTNGGVMDANANKLIVGGNWTTYDQSGFTETGSKVTFNGSSLQAISANVFEQFDSLVINNTSTGVQMNAPVKTNILTLQTGEFNLNGNRITILTPLATAVTGGSNNSYVKSETAVGTPLLATNPSIMEWDMATNTGSHVFPFGVSGTYIPLTFNKLSATSSNIEIATRATTPDNKPWDDVSNVAAVNNMLSGSVGGDGSIPVVIDRWWDIFSSLSGILADVTFSYRASENTLSAPTAALAAQNWDGSFWLPPVCSSCNSGVVVGTGTVAVSNASITSMPWVLSGQSTPLPVELISFTAEKISDNDNVLCRWVTASEINNNYFDVEAATENGSRDLEYKFIGRINGSGNSTTVKEYSLTDTHTGKVGNYYYRLKQVDYDGKASYSNVVVVNFTNGKSLNLVAVAPNPFSNHTSVQIYISEKGNLQTRIVDVFGSKVSSRTFSIVKGLFSFDPEESATLTTGVYFIELVFNEERVISRLVKE